MTAPKSQPKKTSNSALPHQSKAANRLWLGWLGRRYVRRLALMGGFLVIWLLAAYFFYRRFPNNYLEPNFYAEDGKIFAKNIYDHGLLQAMGTTFNGYYIWGLYLLTKLGFVVNSLLFGGEFVNLPRAFAVVSYGFLGLLATLPLALFRKYLPFTALVLVVILSLVVPMPGSDYAVIGAIGNLKFAFIYVAFLLLVYRHFMPENSKKVYVIDLGLLICAYTNVTVYVMLLFALLRYIPKLRKRDFYKQLGQDRSAQSLLILGLALLPQLYIVHRDGVPQLKGYLDTPFNYKRTVEIFVGRSYLYGLLFPVNKFLNDAWVLVMAAMSLGLGLLIRKYRAIFWFGVFTIFVATFLFVVKRTGISDSFFGYKSGGPDQFFYPQNWIFMFIVSLALAQVMGRIKNYRYRQGVLGGLLLAILVFLPAQASTYGHNNTMAQNVGNIYSLSQQQCHTKANHFDIPLYPLPKFMYYEHASRSQLCTPTTMAYYPHTVDLGLAPDGNNYLAGLGSVNQFSQTFQSTHNNLDGLNVYFSTFLKKVGSPYKLSLMTQDCRSHILNVDIPTNKIKDNSYSLIKFSPQPNSVNQTYCFTITASSQPADPLAVQLSADNVYSGGTAIVNGKISLKDVVFNIHYR